MCAAPRPSDKESVLCLMALSQHGRDRGTCHQRHRQVSLSHPSPGDLMGVSCMVRTEVKMSDAGKWARVIAALLLMVIPVYAFITQKEPAVLLLIPFGWLGAFVILRTSLDPRLKFLVMDDEGIEVTGAGVGRKILWSDIKSASIRTLGFGEERGKYIVLELKDEKKYFQGSSRIEVVLRNFIKSFGFKDVSFSLDGADMTREQVLELIHQQIKKNA